MPQNSGESDLIWLFLTLEIPTREKLMQGYRSDWHLTRRCLEGKLIKYQLQKKTWV